MHSKGFSFNSGGLEIGVAGVAASRVARLVYIA